MWREKAKGSNNDNSIQLVVQNSPKIGNHNGDRDSAPNNRNNNNNRNRRSNNNNNDNNNNDASHRKTKGDFLSPNVSKKRKQSQESQHDILEKVVHMYQESVHQQSAENNNATPEIHFPIEVTHKDKIRVMNWNIEWMDTFFKNDTEMEEKCERGNVHDICTKLSLLIKELSPDAISIIEGPSSLLKISLFISKYLDDSFTPFGGFNGGKQRIYILVRKDGNLKDPSVCPGSDEYFSEPWFFDVEGNLTFSEYSFVRKPIVVSAKVNVDGSEKSFFIIALHTKSKYIASGQKLWESKNDDERNMFIRKSVKNRRMIAGECCRIRKYIDSYLYKNFIDPYIVVCGDLNDGPGQDFFEEHYLLFDSVDALLGSPFSGKKCLRPLLIQSKYVPVNDQWTCICYDYVDDVKDRKILLDQIFISHPLSSKVKQATVVHSLFEKYSGGCNRYLSDHRPIFADFQM